MFLFNRSISINVSLVSNKIVAVNGVFLDSQHELCITLEADLESYTITSADGQLRRAPHKDCVHAQDRIKKLVGVNLNCNVRKQIQAAVGLEQGCTHLTDLTLECVKGIVQAKYQLMKLTMQEEEMKIQVEQQLNGSCLHYKKF
ncbi:DUF2889 domain-containing protein [Desulfosporosinus sp. BG]|uniref:DUF2889 domain-containing protein n=1 Tax=Desulfosporosinus sp. BG TaxID=1633135 RepID=UPI00083B578F|nr:DUF2889 domain-containing protein [Desulfosporosinus sp. BG]ODA40157.1 hypothetical protein DSBG_3102 [Desulfosporosinus sp. BG]